MKITLKTTSLLLAPMLALLAACGGSDKDSGTTTPATPTLLSIAVTPATPTVAVGLTQQMTATGTYSDGKSAAITTGLTWSVKGTNITVLPATGLVTGKAIGSDTVTATVGTVAGSTTVNVRGQWDGISAGGNHTVGRRADGALYAWGWNRQGQLGDGSNADRMSPALVSATTGVKLPWKQVAVGELHTLAIDSDGVLWSWGFNQNGQLGDNSLVDKNVPVKVGTAKDWVFIAAGKSHSMAINKSGVMYGWGRNVNGQLGDNTKIDRLVPTRVATVTNGTPAVTVTWVSVSAGATHTLARALDGSLWAWGGNAKSQLGNNATADLALPTRINVTNATWVSVAAGGTHSLAIHSNGTLWAWGDNSSGQLGIPTSNTAVTATTPTQVGTAANWSMITSGLAHSLALRTDGTLYGWGANSNGQVGNGSTVNVGAPTQIGAAITWLTIEAGLQHSVALQKDYTVWTWGRNTEGQLGNGTQTDVTAPAALP
jgi:alpha-tubulin suppressor-like RCC1 family protein